MEKNPRQVFFEKLGQFAEKDNRIILMIGDVGFSYLDTFVERFPNQFINCGVTEQTMMGMAAGMALSGWKPYVYTMVPFVLMRPYEQLRNDVVMHNANVKVIGVRGSVHYKFLGFSHNVEDQDEKNLLASLPGLDSYWVENVEQVEAVMEKTYQSKMPAYIRL